MLDSIKKMLETDGFYILGDTRVCGAKIPIVVVKGRAHSMVIDMELPPERFLETVTVQGPFPPFMSFKSSLEAVRESKKLALIKEIVSDYADGAPDASEASKLANRIYQLLE